MIFRIPFNRSVPTVASTNPDAPGPANQPPKNISLLAGATSKGRLLERISLQKLPASAPHESRFAQTPAQASLLHPRSVRQRPTTPLAKMTPLEQAIRNRIPSLEGKEAPRFEGLLNHLLKSGDVAKQKQLLKIVDARIKKQAPANTGSRQAPSQKMVRVQFRGVSAEMSEGKAAELTDLRLEILKMPKVQAAAHHELLHDILLSKTPGNRDALITGMASQIAQSKARDWEVLKLRADILKLPTDRAAKYTKLLGDVLAMNRSGKYDPMLARMAKQVEQQAKGLR